MNKYNHVVILFDEQGTPTFRLDRETKQFLGIAITYDLTDEENIFNISTESFGLTNTQPLKNSDISNKRVIDITNLLVHLPIQVVISSVDLSNSEFQQTVNLHESLGNLLRAKYRDVRERPLAHILHTRILDECIFNSICNYSESTQQNSNFLISIDNWAIPEKDVDIYLKQRSQSFESKINDLFQKYNPPFKILVPPITLLNTDNNRKRFIGIVTSVISRSFIDQKNARYSEMPINNILNVPRNIHIDITDKTVKLLRDFWDKSLRDPPIV